LFPKPNGKSFCVIVEVIQAILLAYLLSFSQSNLAVFFIYLGMAKTKKGLLHFVSGKKMFT